MITIGRARIVERLEELPPLTPRQLYLDVETRRSHDGLHPYLGDRICGIALTHDERNESWYVPVRHLSGNLPLEPVLAWLQDVLNHTEVWINHNVKFDAHFLAVEGLTWSCELEDTISLAKLLDSDRWHYGLKELAKAWLGYTAEEQDRVRAFLKGAKSKNFADVPADILGEYACTDVLMTRDLYHHCMTNMYEGAPVDTERKLTTVLFNMERKGLLVDQTQTKIAKVKSLRALLAASDQLHSMTGLEFSDSNALFYDVLINQCGLPVLASGKTGASFDKLAMQLYEGHPLVVRNQNNQDVLATLLACRKEQRFTSLFLDSFLNRSDEHGVIHPIYNANIRTGRMSCSDPNVQQISKEASALIVPRPGHTFLCFDASQVEFRIIVHYIQDTDAIAAYNENPKMDFHAWVAELCGLPRKKAAKNINFAKAYGAGRAKITMMLMSQPELMEEFDHTAPDFLEKCEARANKVYDIYEARMPGIKSTAYRAMQLCQVRGWVKNAYGRRRHLPAAHAYKAFNSLVQGCAMDCIKERMVAMNSPYLVANKHDELLYEVPIEEAAALQVSLKEQLENISTFRVPILWEGAQGSNWKEAKE